MIKVGQVWQSEVTSGRVQVVYQVVEDWVGVKILDTNMTNPYLELSSKAFGINLKIVSEDLS